MAPEQADKLISFGQMALEQGWYNQARDYFEQALELAPSNREAIKGLARANEILSRRMPAPVEPKRAEPIKPLRKVSLEPTKPEVTPAEPKRADQLAAMLRGKGHWLALALIVLLLIVVFAYQRVVSVTSVAQPTLADTYFGQRSTDILEQYWDAYQTCDVARMRDLRWQWASLESPAPVRAAHQCVIPCMDYCISACSMLKSFQVEQFLGAADEFERCGECWSRCNAMLKSPK